MDTGDILEPTGFRLLHQYIACKQMVIRAWGFVYMDIEIQDGGQYAG